MLSESKSLKPSNRYKALFWLYDTSVVCSICKKSLLHFFGKLCKKNEVYIKSLPFFFFYKFRDIFFKLLIKTGLITELQTDLSKKSAYRSLQLGYKTGLVKIDFVHYILKIRLLYHGLLCEISDLRLATLGGAVWHFIAARFIADRFIAKIQL